jgi:hypothetical protein
MKIVEIFSHRNGRDILESPKFNHAFQEFLEVLRRLPPYRSAKLKKTSKKHVIAPTAMNKWLEYELCIERDWDWRPFIIGKDAAEEVRESQLRSDFRKDRIEVEVQFGNVARYAYDVYKMAISMALGQADVGIMAVCTKKFAEITGGNIAYFERAVRELERSRLTLIVPLGVIGIEPENWVIDAYPAEQEAPEVTAAMINAVRKQRGKQPVPEEAEEEENLSIKDLKRIMSRVA